MRTHDSCLVEHRTPTSYPAAVAPAFLRAFQNATYTMIPCACPVPLQPEYLGQYPITPIEKDTDQ